MKKVLITGASGDLGFSISKKVAEYFGKECLIILHCFGNKQKALQNAKFLEETFSCQTEVRACDLTNIDETKAFCNEILKAHGYVDILVNNAAVVVDVDFEERTPEMFEKTLRCNLIAPFILSKYLGLEMNKHTGGKIVNISSTNGIDYNSPYSLDYDASKAGLINLTKNLAQALNNVNVNCVCPHWIKTQMNEGLDEDYLKKEAAKTLSGRFAEPDEVAELVMFLISEKAAYLTGQIYSFGSYKN